MPVEVCEVFGKLLDRFWEMLLLMDGMKMRVVLSLVLLGFVLSGCVRNNDYTPSPEASGEKIFKEACVQCHTPVNGSVMILKPEMANADAIMERVKNGKGIGMPAFSNLTGEPARNLAEYVLRNSVTR